MCGLCGMFESGRRWLDAAATLDPAQVRRERLRRIALVRKVLKPARVGVDDWEGANFVLRGPTGKTEIVDNLFDLWRKAEVLGARGLDPLAGTNAAAYVGGSARSPPLIAAKAAIQTTDSSGSPLSWGRAEEKSRHNLSRSDPASDKDDPLPLAEISPASTRIPVHVLTGFLGSGKTTLLNRMLRDPEFADSAVLINEIGVIAIDHELVERITSSDVLDVIVLKDGCACCAVRGDLIEALRELYAKRAEGTLPPFRRVIFETTGLADPAPVLFTLASDPALRHKFEIGTVVTTADALHGAAQSLRHTESRKQLAAADVVVVTKSDLADAETTQALRAKIRRINPVADIVSGQSIRDFARLFAGPRLLSAPSSWSAAAHRLSSGSHLDEHAHAAEHTANVDSIAIVLEQPVPWSAFAVWLTLLLHRHGDWMLRFKALLQVEGWSALVALDGVHHLIHPPIHLPMRAGAPQASHLVFIAEGLQLQHIEPSLRSFLDATHTAV